MDDSTNGLHENGDVISHNEDVVNANEMQNIEENKEEECKIDPDSEKPGSSAEPKRIVEEPVLQRAEAPIVACPLFGVVVARTGMRRIVSNKSFSQSDMEDEEIQRTDSMDDPFQDPDKVQYVAKTQRRDSQDDFLDEVQDVAKTQRRDSQDDFLDEASGLNDPQSMKSPAEEDTPLIKTEVEFTASRPDQMLKDSMSGTKKRIYSEDRSKLKLIHCAEDVRHRSFTFGDKVDGKALNRWREIATAIYHDNGKILDIFIRKGPPWSKSEIQRRLLEAVELNSLKCLDVLCKKYNMEEFSMEKDVVLFHRRYGLSFWPLDERPKETALHVLASKLTSTNAMEVLKKRPKFLTDFSDVPDSHGSTPLLLAIKCNNNDVINGLLLAKPDVNKRNLHEESPLHVAAVNDHDHIIEEILKTYSEPEERTNLLEIMKNIDGKGNSILYSASQSGMTKILNLIMEYDWWENCLEQQKKSEEQDWKSFVCNVCAGGCEGLAKIILQEDPGLLLKWKEGVTPLMRAAKANQLQIVSLIFGIKTDHDHFTTCDKDGRNVFHYAVKNPKVLKLLLDQVKKCKNKEAINKMDKFENTPIKLAAVGNLKESFEMLSQYTRSEADMFSAHLIHNVDIEVLKISLHSWKKREPEAVMRLLSGNHQHQPFLEAARKGNIDLMEFFLQKGANPLQRTSDDQTAIHYAVLSGKLEAVKHLLNKKEFLEMINFTDEVNITAAGYAAQTGFADILRCLLENYNAQMKSDKKTARLNILDSAYGYFKTGEPSIKEIIKFCTKNNKIDILQELFEDSHFGADCIMSKLIEETPDVAMLIFNLCVYKDEYFTHRSYGETELRRRVSYSFFPFMRKHRRSDGKLEAIESMVNFKRNDCLGHPLVIRFLNEKMNSSRILICFVLNFVLYTTFLLALTTYGAIQSQGVYSLHSPGMIALSVIILIICAFHYIKELLQMKFNKTDYFIDFENYIEWVIYIGTVVYVLPGRSTKANAQIVAGAISIFLAWINFALFLKRFSFFGIYIIMTKRVFLTVCKVLPLVVLFIAAFSFSLSLLMPLDQGFNNVPVSLLTTFVMMTGDLDYRGTFLANGSLHVLRKIFLVLFILMVSIAIMNLLTGLAVGDTNEIMNRSKEKKRIYKATLVITLERNLHNFPIFSPPKIKNINIQDHPDEKVECSSSWLLRQWEKVYDDEELEERLNEMKNDEEDHEKKLDGLREEIKKTNDLVHKNTAAMETKIENRLKNIEAMLAQIQAGGILHSSN